MINLKNKIEYLLDEKPLLFALYFSLILAGFIYLVHGTFLGRLIADFFDIVTFVILGFFIILVIIDPFLKRRK